MKQFMVRIVRSTDDEYADVVVDADNEDQAQEIALRIVRANQSEWFSEPDPPTYSVDQSSEVEDVTGGEYASYQEHTK